VWNSVGAAEPGDDTRVHTTPAAPSDRVRMKKSSTPASAIQLLGNFQVRVRGRPVEEARWPRRQAKLLVKLLALDPKHQLHRQQLIDAICPGLNAESGAANLHKIIHLARQQRSARERFAVLFTSTSRRLSMRGRTLRFPAS
jgi:two-component SAPR family response regulator